MVNNNKHNNKWNQRVKFYRVTAFGFILMLAAGLAYFAVTKDKTFSREENRYLQQFPEITVDGFFSGEFQEKFQNYANDQFPGRDKLVQIKVQMDVLLGKEESNNVILGKDDYLMEKFLPENDHICEEKMELVQKMCQSHPNISWYFLLAPTAVNILSDKLPKGIPLTNQNDYMDETMEKFTLAGGTAIDVRTEFLAHKEEVFYHTDHHWTSKGAWIAAQKAIEIMGYDVNSLEYESMPVYNDFSGTLSSKSGFNRQYRDRIDVYFPVDDALKVEVTYVEEKVKKNSFYNHEKLEEKDSYQVFLDGNHSLVSIETSTDNESCLLVLKDSYANCFVPFFAPYYHKILMIDPRYYYDSLEELIQVEEVDDVLYLYNANTFFTDTTLTGLLKSTAEK